MTEQEKTALNRRVAVAMGWVLTHENAGKRPGVDPRNASGILPDFCTDPAAADLVRLEVERRGWGLRFDYPCIGIVGADERGWSCFIWDDAFEEFSCGKSSPWIALCLAFLAAHEQEGDKP